MGSQARAFTSAVLGPDETEALQDLVDLRDTLPVVAEAMLRRDGGFEGVLPGTSVPAVVQRGPGGWYGVVPGYSWGPSGLHHSAAAVAAAVDSPGPHELKSAGRAAEVIDAVVAAATVLRRTDEPPVSQASQASQVASLRTSEFAPRPRAKARGTIKIAAELVRRACPLCSLPRVVAGALVGCPCVSALLATAVVRRLHDSYLVTPGPQWEPGDPRALLEALQ